MNETLFFKTFFLVGSMLLITSIGARFNKAYETTLPQRSVIEIPLQGFRSNLLGVLDFTHLL